MAGKQNFPSVVRKRKGRKYERRPRKFFGEGAHVGAGDRGNGDFLGLGTSVGNAIGMDATHASAD